MLRADIEILYFYCWHVVAYLIWLLNVYSLLSSYDKCGHLSAQAVTDRHTVLPLFNVYILPFLSMLLKNNTSNATLKYCRKPKYWAF